MVCTSHFTSTLRPVQLKLDQSDLLWQRSPFQPGGLRAAGAFQWSNSAFIVSARSAGLGFRLDARLPCVFRCFLLLLFFFLTEGVNLGFVGNLTFGEHSNIILYQGRVYSGDKCVTVLFPLVGFNKDVITTGHMLSFFSRTRQSKWTARHPTNMPMPSKSPESPAMRLPWGKQSQEENFNFLVEIKLGFH